jgi:hypothetical protein
MMNEQIHHEQISWIVLAGIASGYRGRSHVFASKNSAGRRALNGNDRKGI